MDQHEKDLSRYEFIELAMSNLDQSIDRNLGPTLQRGKYYARHHARDFGGDLWWENGFFHEQVWQFGKFQGIISASTLPDLMVAVNRKFGWN
jgi:hypothetical protein